MRTTGGTYWVSDFVVCILSAPLIELIGLMDLPKVSGNKSPLSPYFPSGYISRKSVLGTSFSSAEPKIETLDHN